MKLLRVLLLVSAPLFAERYALFLEEAPRAAGGARTRVLAAQTSVRDLLARSEIRVTGSVSRILNAVFVEVPPERAAELAALPGVRGVVKMRRHTLKLDRAAQLVNAPAAWAALGGNAGAGIKIAVIDTGIQHTHAAFQDPALSVPRGYPLCQGEDCRFTNNKVIVARSYIAQLGAGGSFDPAAESRPDDLSPRDRMGHGTAVATAAAGVPNRGAAGVTISGIAPKAWLGNYKVFGSPGINDRTSSDLVIQALEQALDDGMDVAVLALGGPALSGPLDTGAACGRPAGVPCDPEAVAVENVIREGLVVVAAAGNEGDLGERFPALSSVSAPATAPSVIAAGGTTNGHVFLNSVRLSGDGVPEPLRRIAAIFGDGVIPPAPVTGPLRDVTGLGGDDGTACRALPAGSLPRALALIRRGGCNFIVKLLNAQQAGAAGAVLWMNEAGAPLAKPGGLKAADIPAVMISFEAGTALRDFLATHPDHPASLDPGLAPTTTDDADHIVDFSSRGPSIGNGAIKPDVLAVGSNLYMATQTLDPEGGMYDPTGYIMAAGTSFSAPMVAGGVALAKQQHPGYSPAQLRSAVINTASPEVFDDGERARVTAAGAGKLDAAAALRTTVTVEPATISFGVIEPGTLPLNRQLVVTNTASGPASLTLKLEPRTPETTAHVTLTPASLALAAGQSGTVTVTLAGTRPAAGPYEGALVIAGGATTLRVPYLYLVGDGVPYNILPLFGFGFVGTVSEGHPDGGIAFRVTDRYGVSVPDVAVSFRMTRGGGVVELADRVTDRYGIADAGAVLGPLPGVQEFVGTAGALSTTFSGIARLKPTITAGGVVNAASFATDQPVAPGSYIAIFGADLSDVSRAASTAELPVSLSGVNVSFDAPGVSVPGRLWYVSPQQVNVQVPWELAGQTSARIKVNIGYTTGRLATIRLAAHAPAAFAYESAGARLAVAQNARFELITQSNPARRGETVVVYANGLGPVDHRPASGEPSAADPLARTASLPTVTVGGRPAVVAFSGLTPGCVGLYQLNVTVPADAAAGTQPLVISVGGVSSPAVNLPVQ